MGYSLGKKSNENMQHVHSDLKKVVLSFIQISLIDFGISHGHRTPEFQFQLFQKGRSFDGKKWVITDKSKVVTFCDGYTKKSKHNQNPSIAIDFFVWIPGHKDLAYDKAHLCYLGAGFQTTAAFLYYTGEIKHLVRWGGNWNNDGVIIYDQTLQDLCHIELYKP